MIKEIQVCIFASILFGQLAFALPPELKEIRQQAREVLERKSCANCHTPGLLTSQKRALKIYDLSKESWISSVPESKLDSLITRATQGTGPQPRGSKLNDIDSRSLPFSGQELALISKLVEAEKKYRKANPIDSLNETLNSGR